MVTWWFLLLFVTGTSNQFEPVMHPEVFSNQWECQEAGKRMSNESAVSLFFTCEPWTTVYAKTGKNEQKRN